MRRREAKKGGREEGAKNGGTPFRRAAHYACFYFEPPPSSPPVPLLSSTNCVPLRWRTRFLRAREGSAREDIAPIGGNKMAWHPKSDSPPFAFALLVSSLSLRVSSEFPIPRLAGQ